jgi:hypothetical protein
MIKIHKSPMKKDMPNPSDYDLESEEFKAIWEVIKSWDISAPKYYNGYCGANGSHVKVILDALRPIIRNKKIDSII